MESNGNLVVSANFQRLDRPVGPGWSMLVSLVTRNIQHLAVGFMARVGEQHLRALAISQEGDRVEGYLERTPNEGDRLFVGYGAANNPTRITYTARASRPPVA